MITSGILSIVLFVAGLLVGRQNPTLSAAAAKLAGAVAARAKAEIDKAKQ